MFIVVPPICQYNGIVCTDDLQTRWGLASYNTRFNARFASENTYTKLWIWLLLSIRSVCWFSLNLEFVSFFRDSPFWINLWIWYLCLYVCTRHEHNAWLYFIQFLKLIPILNCNDINFMKSKTPSMSLCCNILRHGTPHSTEKENKKFSFNNMVLLWSLQNSVLIQNYTPDEYSSYNISQFILTYTQYNI